MFMREWNTASSLVVKSGLAALLVTGVSGCQVDVGGQTLPSPYYLQDDLHYAPAGPEFKLSREAAAMKAYEASFEAESP